MEALSDDKLKIDLALKIIRGIDWHSETINMIQSKISTVEDILSHAYLWTPKKRGKK